MVEENTTTTTAETTETTTPPPSFIAEDGNFTENWTQALKDTALHDDATLKTLTNIDMLAGNHVLQRKKIGGNTVLIPTEASSEAEWSEFHKAGGRPETAGDYAFKKRDDIPEENYNQEVATALQELLFKHGASKGLADAIMAFNDNNTIATLTKNKQDSDLQMQTLEDGLHTDWGSAFEQKKHLGNIAVDEGTSTIQNGVKTVDEEFKERLTQKFGTDPDFVRAMSNLGSKFAEAGTVMIDLVPTPSDIQEQINTITGSPAYGLKYAEHGFTKQQHQDAVKKASLLFQQKTKVAKTG